MDEKETKYQKVIDKMDAGNAVLTVEDMKVLSEKHQHDGVPDNWDDFYAMLKDMKNYAKENNVIIEAADRPHQLRLGYCVVGGEKTWSIRIGAAKKSLDNLETDKAEILRKCLQSQEGRQNLLNSINGIGIIDAMDKGLLPFV